VGLSSVWYKGSVKNNEDTMSKKMEIGYKTKILHSSFFTTFLNIFQLESDKLAATTFFLIDIYYVDRCFAMKAC
jgi:hypothetical protein